MNAASHLDAPAAGTAGPSGRKRFGIPGRRGAGARRAAAALAVLGALSLFGGVARAQDVDPGVAKKYSIRVGGFFPTQGTLRNQSGQPYYVIGGTYTPNFRTRPANADIVFGLDFMWRDSGPQGFLTVPLTAQLQWTLSPMEWPTRVYGGVGLGVYFINTGFIGGTTQAGARFVLGAEFRRRYYLELDYDYVGGFTDYLGNGLRVDGLNVVGGFRF